MEGDFFLQFLLPYMDDLRMKSYPEPSKKGWEQEYQFAFASDKVLTQLITVIQAWISEGKALSQDENEPEKNIIDA